MLAAVIVADNTLFAAGPLFLYADISLIACAMLAVSGRKVEAAVFAAIAGVYADLTSMPFAGLSAASGLASAFVMAALADNLYRENFMTRVFILLCGIAAKAAANAVLVYFFYLEREIPGLTGSLLLRVLATTLAGAAVIKITETDPRAVMNWLKTAFARR